jgi:hypothetical protein
VPYSNSVICAQVSVRQEGKTAGGSDAYFYDPKGVKFRSRVEVARKLGLEIPTPEKKKGTPVKSGNKASPSPLVAASKVLQMPKLDRPLSGTSKSSKGTEKSPGSSAAATPSGTATIRAVPTTGTPVDLTTHSSADRDRVPKQEQGTTADVAVPLPNTGPMSGISTSAKLGGDMKRHVNISTKGAPPGGSSAQRPVKDLSPAPTSNGVRTMSIAQAHEKAATAGPAGSLSAVRKPEPRPPLPSHLPSQGNEKRRKSMPPSGASDRAGLHPTQQDRPALGIQKPVPSLHDRRIGGAPSTAAVRSGLLPGRLAVSTQKSVQGSEDRHRSPAGGAFLSPRPQRTAEERAAEAARQICKGKVDNEPEEARSATNALLKAVESMHYHTCALIWLYCQCVGTMCSAYICGVFEDLC